MNIKKINQASTLAGTLTYKITVMKKSFLFCIFAITFFCFMSLAIKSETSCSSVCTYISKNRNLVDLQILSSEIKITDFRNEPLFIKI